MMMRKSGPPSNQRRVAVYQSPNMAASRSQRNRHDDVNSGVKKQPRRIADPRDAKDRTNNVPTKDPTRRISVATPCVTRLEPERPSSTPQRRKSAPAKPANMGELNPQERLLIANFRLQQNHINSQTPQISSSLKSGVSNNSKKNRRVSFFQPGEEVTLTPLAEEAEF